MSNPFFTIRNASIRNRNGESLSLEQTTTNGDMTTFSNKEIGEIQVAYTSQSSIIGVSLLGKLAKDPCPFAFQPAFHDQQGVQITLSLANEAEFISIYQHKEWWLRPAFGNHVSEIPRRSQLVIFKTDEYHAFLAVCGDDNRTDLHGTSEGLVVSQSSNLSNQTYQSDLSFIYGHGSEPYSLVESMVNYALKLMNKRLRPRKEKKFPDIFSKIGWCTWDSLGQNVNESEILLKMNEFKEKNIPLGWVLIDDGWSEANQKALRLAGIDANQEKFPHGLKGIIDQLKQEYGIEHVGIWQAIFGYWEGIEPGSQAETLFAPYLTRYPNGNITIKPEAEAAFGFWNLWHSHLKNCGVDFVKVDGQSSFSIAATGTLTYGKLAKAIHIGLDASADLHFDGNLINCMGMGSEDVWNRQSSLLSRNSDDFFPKIPESFVEHALQNCYNSIYHGCFYWTDWDMTWSKHEDAIPNMMIRVMSGGPLYLSDSLGQTDASQIWPAILDDGTIIRCDDIAKPTLDCLFNGGNQGNGIIKIFNTYKDSIYIAAVPCKHTNETLHGTIQASDLPIKLPDSFWIYDWHSQQYWLCKQDSIINFDLQPRSAKLFCIIPNTDDFALVGIISKFISTGCIDRVFKENNKLLITLKISGSFCLLTTKNLKSIQQNDKDISFTKNEHHYLIENVQKDHLLHILFE